jgi:hypothetical protein
MPKFKMWVKYKISGKVCVTVEGDNEVAAGENVAPLLSEAVVADIGAGKKYGFDICDVEQVEPGE